MIETWQGVEEFDDRCCIVRCEAFNVFFKVIDPSLIGVTSDPFKISLGPLRIGLNCNQGSNDLGAVEELEL